MRYDYTRHIATLSLEEAALEHELAHAPEAVRAGLRARLASVQRSLQWYRSRSRVTRAPQALGVGLTEYISTEEHL